MTIDEPSTHPGGGVEKLGIHFALLQQNRAYLDKTTETQMYDDFNSYNLVRAMEFIENMLLKWNKIHFYYVLEDDLVCNVAMRKRYQQKEEVEHNERLKTDLR